MSRMWIVRASTAGRLAGDFLEKGIVAIGWIEAGNMLGLKDRAAFIEQVGKGYPDGKKAMVVNAASQLYRFMHDIKVGDRVITYDPSRRIYSVGEIISATAYDESLIEDLPNYRKVRWTGEVPRDNLSPTAKNSLGGIMTFYLVPADTVAEIDALVTGKSEKKEANAAPVVEEEDLLRDLQERAKEFIKDRVSKLDWDELQSLVAGLLRAMGYKTRISPSGPDRGKDIIASPDGFGFESPRIIVEVKHRKGQQMGAPDIRSFSGVIRHAADKGLYVSTGGFSKEAYYEAERAANPLTLMDVDDLVGAIVEHYENMDTETRVLLPLTKVYWPV
jgi:restriction system protein